ncbi:MAG: purine/pyrimidine permease [Dehalococcoidia bacterium]|nr:purine/pyrimidine permease [Dehalococcoidia bacterium]
MTEPRKPSNLLYGLNDRPPFWVTMALGLQHVFILFISLIFPAIIVNLLGSSIDPHSARSFVSLSMIAGGVITILQAIRTRHFGSGYLCPAVCGPSYLSASILAVTAGGLPLLFGMTAVAGAMEVAFSRVMNRLRFLFPAEVMGIIVALIGIVIIPLAVKNFFGISGVDTVTTSAELTVAGITIATMIGINVWVKGKLRLYSIIIGMVVGYGLSYAFGILDGASLSRVGEAEWFSIPYISNMSWAFDITILVPFIVATICSTFKTVGDLGTCQKINDAEWKRPDMERIAPGILVDGIGGILPGIIGGFGQSTSSSNVGLSVATGSTSRIIAYAAGGIIIVLAFFPRLSELFIIMPPPVMGATLIFAISFMIIAGFQIIGTRVLDVRRTFTLGFALIFGLSADIMPQLYASVHPWIKPVFSSSLALGTVTAIVMNAIMRIGISDRSSLTLEPGRHSSEDIFEFVEKQGGTWGARREVIYKAAGALTEAFESVSGLDLAKSPVQVEMKFDELNLDIDITYDGALLPLPMTPPSPDELLEDDAAIGKLSGFLIRQRVDKVSSSLKDGHCSIHFHYDH